MNHIVTDRRVLARALRHNGAVKRLIVVDRLGPTLRLYPFTGEIHSTTYFESPLLLIGDHGSPSVTTLLLNLG